MKTTTETRTALSNWDAILVLDGGGNYWLKPKADESPTIVRNPRVIALGSPKAKSMIEELNLEPFQAVGDEISFGPPCNRTPDGFLAVPVMDRTADGPGKFSAATIATVTVDFPKGGIRVDFRQGGTLDHVANGLHYLTNRFDALESLKAIVEFFAKKMNKEGGAS